MRIRILSDVHLELAPFDPPTVRADVVVLAGDIANGAAGIEWAREHFDAPVLYVAGNHEYYDGEFGEVRSTLAAAAHRCSVTLLDCGETAIDGIRFLGCTLWTDFTLAPEARRPEVIEEGRRLNPDYLAIRRGNRRFSPEDAIALCRAHKAWLADKLAQPWPGPTVVITHFAPHSKSIAPAFIDDPANPGFIVPLDDMMGGPVLWIHGHTHTAADYSVRGTRVLCNPRGNPDERTGFDPELCVTPGDSPV
jgi:predicted phosphodiesterase